ncbi:MAG: hypothetical protein MJY88_06680 [Bacteroidales bacterium]|nr:hypothetical protein [Bacteroidales bacterium]
MKKLTVIALTAVMLMGSFVAKAQGKFGADSAECIKYLSYYSEYYKQKNYDEAIPNWRQAYKLCPPQSRQGLLVDGSTLVRRLITKNASNAAYKQALVDTLLTLHDLRAQHFPTSATTALNNKGTDINNYLKGNDEAMYKGLDDIITKLGADTKATILLFDLNSAIALFQAGKLDAETVINTYQRNISLVDQLTAKTDAEKTQNSNVKTDMESLFISSKVASCDNLIALFGPRYEADKNNLDLATNIVKMMSSADNCTSNDLYLQAATTMHSLQPTAQSAYFLYRLNNSKGNADAASKYMEEALASADITPEQAAQYNYEYATFCVKNQMNAKGFEAAQKAMELDSSKTGSCYYLMGTIWGSLACGGDEIAKRAKYWVACDYMNKAKAADESLTEDCNKMIGAYSVYFPQTAEAFMYDLTNGQSYSISCGGLRATTTVRTQK